jgi:hypothetical protein
MAKKTPKPVSKQTHYHEFHAKAHLLSGELKHPVHRTIKPHSEVTLNGTRGGHHTRVAQNINIDGLIHLRKGHTRVSGGGTLKHKGYITLATAVLEGLNVFEVVAADRVVSQVSTEHAYEDGHIPSVTFLGSHFDNLRINGFAVELTLNLGICGRKPANDQSYLEDATFLNAARAQIEKVAKADGLPKDLATEYANRLAAIDALRGGERDPKLEATCSLVQSIDNIGKIPVPGIRAVGHVLVIPEFGWVALGEVEVSAEFYKFPPPPRNVSNCLTLNMLNIHLGCIGGGKITGGGGSSNGHTIP